MELRDAIYNRRSIRGYEECEITKEEIEAIIKSAQMSPSWKYSQTQRFYVAHSKEAKEKMGECLASFNRERTQNAGAYIVTTVVKGISGYTDRGATHLANGFECFDNGLAVQNLLLTAYEMGYGTLIMGLYKEDKIRSLFDIPENEAVVVVIAIGKAALKPEAPERNDTDKVLKIF